MIDGPSPLRVLLAEDLADDAELVLRTLRDGGLAIEPRVVATEAEFRLSLTPRPDVVIVDWTLPGFSGAAALAIAHESSASVPCILISGTLGEDLVVAALRNGAVAYVPKNRLEALVPAVHRALAEAATRRERDRLASVIEESIDGIVIAGPDDRIVYFNDAFSDDVGRGRGDLLGQALPPILTDLLGAALVADITRTAAAGTRWIREIELDQSQGTGIRFQVAVTPLWDVDRATSGRVATFRDVTKLRTLEAEVALEVLVRAAVADSLRSVSADATLGQAAQAICDQLVTLPCIDVAAVDAYLGADDAQVVGHAAPAGFPIAVGDHLPPTRVANLLERLRAGPWADYTVADPADGAWMAKIAASGLKASAYGPIACGGEVIGFLMIGTLDECFAHTLVEEMPGLASFGATSSALLVDRLHEMRREAELRESLKGLLAAGSFHPVFQPIVDLESREVVGYEALTRFDSGQRPDLCFADAWSVDMGPDLEMATLEAAIAAARRLPAGRWLNLNVSPHLLADPERLNAALWLADRPLVLEITEHEIIEDYAAMREAVRALDNEVRLAVDDAGAGVANFGHIIDLRPDFVKLDVSLVRHVDADLRRQAMIVGIGHFSLRTDCRLIAEGVETEAEARMLNELGVEFGQGYLFGHPEPAEAWVAAGKAGEPRD
jgi:PAS domain S-box-containing protein